MKLKYLLMMFAITFIASFNKLSAQDITKSQSTFTIKSNNSDKNDLYFLNALKDANMESYRLKNKDVEIFFKEKTTCMIKSAISLKNNGVEINLNEYKNEFTEGYLLPIFSINQNGHILAEHKKKLK